MIRNFNKFLKIGKELFHPRLSTPLFAPFHSSQSFNKKLGIGEASVVLEDKISKISQLVPFFRFFKGFSFFSSLISSFSNDPIFFFIVEWYQRIRNSHFNRRWYRQSVRFDQGASRRNGGVQQGCARHGPEPRNRQCGYCGLG